VNEHGDVFFFIMPSKIGHQHAASHPVHKHLVFVFEGLFPCALVWNGLPTRLCEEMVKKRHPHAHRPHQGYFFALN